MVPIDAPASYTFKHCLWVQDVLQRMQERQTGLNVFLLDMCRKRCGLIHKFIISELLYLKYYLNLTAVVLFIQKPKR